MIKPTVGRVVLYTPSENDCKGAGGMARPYSGGKCAAIVTCVHGDKMINLAVFDANGKLFPVTSVSLLQDDDKPAVDAEGKEYGRYCEWMEYQKGQAAKTEELEKRLDNKASLE